MSDFNLPPKPLRKPEIPVADASGYPQPRRKPVGTPAASAKGNAAAPELFAESARSAARIAHVPFADVLAKAAQESNFNPNLRSSQSSAAGPYQFVEHTWLDMLKRHGAAYGLGKEAAQIKMHNGVASVSDPALRKRLLDLRQDVPLSSAMAARYLNESSHDLGRSLGRTPTATEARIAYVLGPGGAAKLIRAARSHPDGLAASAVPQAAAANRPLFYGAQGSLTNREAMAKLTHFVSSHLADFAALGKEDTPLTTDRMVVSDPNVG